MTQLRTLLIAALFVLPGIAATAQEALVSESGTSFFVDIESGQQLSVVTNQTTYTITLSPGTFTNSGIIDPTTVSGFGTSTLTIEANGLARWDTFVFSGAAFSNNSVIFPSSGLSSFSDSLQVDLRGNNSFASLLGLRVVGGSLDVRADAISIGGNVTTDAFQTYRGAITLGASALLTESTGDITFDGTLDGAHNLTSSAAGTISFNGTVGGTTPLGNLQVTMGSVLLSQVMTTTGLQAYGGGVTPRAFTTTLRAGEIDFLGGADSVAGTLNLVLQPYDPASVVNVGFSSDVGGLDLTDTDLAALADGFSTLSIGHPSATAPVNVSTANLRDPTTITGLGIVVDGLSVAGAMATLQPLTAAVSSPGGAAAAPVDVTASSVRFGGIVAPGASPGVFTIDGDVDLKDDELQIEIAGTTPGTEHDQLRIQGPNRTVTLNNTVLTIDSSAYPLPAPSDQITILDLVDAGSSVSGTFNGLAEGDLVDVGMFQLSITYVGGDGNDVVLQPPPAVTDHGDAPDPGVAAGVPTYPTLAASNGPSHQTTQWLRLGGASDGEADGLPNDAANGDDADHLSNLRRPVDEDGLAFELRELALTTGDVTKVRLHATNLDGSTATLSGWIDYDRDGVFDNATERAQTTVPDGTLGTVTLTFPAVPVGAEGTTYARFRLSTDPAASDPTGAASDGEVEDYAIRIVAPSDAWVRSRPEIDSNTVNGPSLADSAGFGSAIVTIGDVDGDGIQDLAAGAPGASTVFVHFMSSDATIKSTSAITGSGYGPAVAPLGDLDGDGVADLAIGQPSEGYQPSPGAATRGNVGALDIAFLNSDGSLKGSSHYAPGGPGGQRFGASLANIGDLDGDGVIDLAVGLPGDKGGVSIVFLNSDGTVRSSVGIGSGTNGGPPLDSGDNFGAAVTALGDLNGDGVTDLAVGAPGDERPEVFSDGGQPPMNRGAFYVVRLNADGTAKSSRLLRAGQNGVPGLEDNDRLGSSIAALGDLDGDGVGDVAVGVPNRSTRTSSQPAIQRGAVFLFFLNPNGTIKGSLQIHRNSRNGPPLSNNDHFGSALGALGDVNGDGIPDLGVGTPGKDAGGNNRGRVYLLLLNGPPVITEGDAASVTMDEDGVPTAFDLTLNAADANGDTLTWSIPSTGAATNGVATASGTGTSKAIGYAPSSNFAGTDAFVVRVSDGNSYDEITVNVTVRAVNDPPTLTALSPIAVTEDVASALTGISVSDPDAGSNTVRLSLGVLSGALAATSGGGVTVSGSSAALDLDGSLAAINAFVAGGAVTFTTAPNATANVVLSLVLSDLGSTGSGGTLTDSTTATLQVSAVNDPPSITAPASILVTEDTATALAGISFADVDADPGAVHVTLSVARGALVAATGGGVTVGGTPTAITLDGTLAALNAFLAADSVTFTPAADSTADVTLSLLIDDQSHTGSGGAKTASQDVTLALDAVNDPPTIMAPTSIAVSEDVPQALTSISFADPDSDPDSVHVALTVGSGALSVATGAGVNVGGTPTALTLDGTVTAINAFLAAGRLTFTTDLDAVANVTLGILIDDQGHNGSGGAMTASQGVTLAVAPVNDPPTITAPPSVAVTEDTPTAVTGISFADVDADAGLDPVSVTLGVGSGALVATTGGGVAVGGSATALTLDGTLTAINAFLAAGNVTFTPAADSTIDVTLAVLIDDQGHNGGGGAMTASQDVTLAIAAVNDPPSIVVPATVPIEEDVPSPVLGVRVADVDSGPDAVLVTLSVPRGSLAATSGGGVTVGGSASNLTLGGAVTAIDTFLAAGNVTFTTAPSDTANVTLTVVIDDQGHNGSGGAMTASDTTTLVVSPANDPPIITAPVSMGVTEDVASALIGLVFADPDAGSNAVLVTLSVPSGSLAAGPAAGVVVAGSASNLTLEGSFTAINNLIAGGGLTFTTAPNAVSTVTLMVTIDDQGNSGAGGPLTDSATVDLLVTSVNDPPTIDAPTSLSLTVGRAHPLSSFAFDDAEAGNLDVLVTLTVSDGQLAYGPMPIGTGPASLAQSKPALALTPGGSPTSLTLLGSLAELNAAFAGGLVTFTADTPGDLTLEIEIDDLGAGDGPPEQTRATVLISVVAQPSAVEIPTLGSWAAALFGLLLLAAALTRLRGTAP